RRTPIGVFRQVDRVTYDDLMGAQIEKSISKQGPGELATLLAGGDTWTVS
ncbi:MAG TPA: 2-oxoacid:ferredoxin oxidoreductase subunit beta, partial [Actinomycetes bacterium]|nr:2-oxoacid:ferredoxin oxidoreductase subunit beta [Actinomycetes bacterium]